MKFFIAFSALHKLAIPNYSNEEASLGYPFNLMEK